jgi:hypothetical protein
MSTTTSFGTPTEIAELNDATATDSAPVLSADGLEIFFSTNRAGGNNTDIWRATRTSPTGTFGTPTAVSELNTASVEIPSWVSPDRCRIILSSDALGAYDIYMATRPR